ncbi:hypothetical protein AL541_25425 [Vibrio alginolyticus]|nr:hypothetical protein AL541_25425 [Vibrio alginolyticus]
MVSIYRINVAILIFYIAMLPFEMFKLPVFRVSPGKLVLLLMVVFLFIQIVITKKISSRKCFYIFSIFLSSIVFSNIFVTNFWGLDSSKLAEYLPSFVLGVFIFFTSSAIMSSKYFDVYKIQIILKYTVFMIVVMAIYNYLSIHILGKAPFSFLGADYFQPMATNEKISRGLRLYMPTATPPRLAFLVGMLCLLLMHLVFERKQGKVWFILVFLIAFFILVNTGSRTGMIPFVLGGGYYLFSRVVRLRDVKSCTIFLLCIFLFSSLLPLILSSDSRAVSFSLEEGSSLARHVLIRLDALDLLMNADIERLIFGFGTGQFSYYNSTEAPYTFTLLLTVFIDNGILGLVSVVLFLSMFLQKNKYVNSLPKKEKIIMSSLCLCFVMSSFFYELKAEPYFWVIGSMLLMYPKVYYRENISNNNILQCTRNYS